MKRTTLGLLAVLTVAVAVAAGAAVATNGPKTVEFTFTGRLLADPASNATSLSVDVKTGNRIALQKLVGSSSKQAFSLAAETELLLSAGAPPRVLPISALTVDARRAVALVTVGRRAAHDRTLAEVAATPAKMGADRGLIPGKPHRALWLFRGTLNGPASTSTLGIHVLDGNHRALRSMLGAPV